MIKFKIGKLIKEKRVEAGLSQSNLSDKMGWTSPQFVSNIERGLCGVPVDKFLLFSKLLKINLDVLIAADVAEYERHLRARLKR